jgi:GTP:adenosylcobinamide-phosphate guanylyltransferase
MTDNNGYKNDIAAVILAGGSTEESLREYTDAPSKSFIDIAGKPMVEYVIDSLKKVKPVSRIILVSDPDNITDEIRTKVDIIAPDGKTIMHSLRSAVDHLDSTPQYLLILPCDVPLITPEAIDDFISRSLSPPVDITYGYLSRSDSESVFPDVRRTYIKIKDGTFCGTGLFMMKLDVIETCENLFKKLTGNRKNIFALVSLLGPVIILKYLLKILTVKDAEKRMSKLMGGCTGRAIRTGYADAAFNVDSPEDLLIARKILESSAPGNK